MRLRKVDVSCNVLIEEDLKKLMSPSGSLGETLEILKMVNCGIFGDGKTEENEFEDKCVVLEKLEELNVSYNSKFFSISNNLIKSILPASLKTITAVSTGITINNLQLIQSRCPDLTHLDISENKITENGLFQVIPDKLETLLMRNCKFFYYLEPLVHQNLIRLDVSGVCLKNETLNFIDEFVLKMEIPKLKVLMLEDNFVNNEGLWKLMLSVTINNLDILSLKNNLIISIHNESLLIIYYRTANNSLIAKKLKC